MVALQRADLSFRAVTEVRNKLVDAYKDIMNMQV
jgi:flagellar hook-basal body complex protein FliE